MREVLLECQDEVKHDYVSELILSTVEEQQALRMSLDDPDGFVSMLITRENAGKIQDAITKWMIANPPADYNTDDDLDAEL